MPGVVVVAKNFQNKKDLGLFLYRNILLDKLLFNMIELT